LSDFFGQKDSRISYQNALVMEEEGELVGVAIFYDGARARELDAPLERAAPRSRAIPIIVSPRNRKRRVLPGYP
jgi:hypothetical protein